MKLNFGSVAHVAKSHDEFIARCAQEAKSPSRSRIARGLKLASENTWEAIIARMEKHIADVLSDDETAADAAALDTAKLPGLAYV